jgi:NAD(P)-dependent dehydrogenase (short-subunit alcohol dehydrogenase family)
VVASPTPDWWAGDVKGCRCGLCPDCIHDGPTRGASREPTDQLHVVLGATGGAGGALVRELAGRGHRVRAVSRKPAAALPEGVEQLTADAADPAQTRTACQGATVVYHCVQRAFGPLEPTPHPQAVATTVAWFQQRAGRTRR